MSKKFKVYVLMEHAFYHCSARGGATPRDAYIHGVYVSKEAAEFKREKLLTDNMQHGYLCVLTKMLKGAQSLGEGLSGRSLVLAHANQKEDI